jgi:cytochrome c oxidase subunit 2
MIALATFSQSALDPRGPQSQHIYALWHLLLWVSVAVWILVAAFFIGALVRTRQSKPPTNDHKLMRMVVGATSITVVTLFVLLVASILTGNALATRPSQTPLSIQVVGHQWWWEFQYEYSQPSDNVITANEIHIPVGRPVILKATSHDVIHSVWIPNLYGKIDAIPAHVNTVWLRADRPGFYRGQCAEFCGLQHAHMAMLVYADPPDKFQQWLTAQRSAAKSTTDAAIERGRAIFMNAPCVNCHTIRGTDAAGTAGPDLTHLGSRSTLAAGTIPNTTGNLAGWITDTQTVKPGNNMPPINLSPEDIQPLATFLESLK